MFQTRTTWMVFAVAFAAGAAFAQTSATQGIPIDHQLTISKCGGCHQRDTNGMMRRLSYIRTTPEVWQQAIKRMVRLNGVSVSADEAREIVKYLSANNGLAPEEAKAGFWEPEHRTEGYQDDHVPNAAIQRTCNYCHSIGRVIAQRRTRDDYEKLVAMHIGLFPNVENGVFRPARNAAPPISQVAARQLTSANGGITLEPPRAAPAAGANAKAPVDVAVDYLASAQPLITPEWTSWKAAMRPAKLAGNWLLTATQTGKGKVYGQVTITAGAKDDEFASAIELNYTSTGTSLKFSGKSILYTGYSWRGRSTTTAASTNPAIPTEVREAMMLSRDGNTLEGRWFWGAFGELGMDVKLTRLGSEPIVLGTDVSALMSPSKREVKIYGGNHPALKVADIDLGRGVAITKVISSTPTMATVEVEVAKGLPVGMHDLSIGRTTAVNALAVYDKVSYVKVTPNAMISRLGGVKYPKEYAQYEATAFANGPDGKPGTADDLSLGPISAKWSLEEFYSTPDDDDAKFVGTVDDSGLFTPNVEGPNPARKKQDNNFGVNNFGDVWVMATYTTPEGTWKAQSYLVVTVPNYTLYDQPEVAR
jgi:quinohemoprotein amine dehydrogenase